MVQEQAHVLGGARRKHFNMSIELIERTYDYGVASQSLQEKIKKMEAVEDFESKPHKAVTFLLGRDKEILELLGLKMPKTLPGYSGGKLLGRSAAEVGREGK